jgi:hypothetical protein
MNRHKRVRDYLREARDATDAQMREAWITEARDEAAKIDDLDEQDALFREVDDVARECRDGHEAGGGES